MSWGWYFLQPAASPTGHWPKYRGAVHEANHQQATGKARGAQIAAVVPSVLSSGVFFGTVASLTPSKRGFDSRTYITVQQA